MLWRPIETRAVFVNGRIPGGFLKRSGYWSGDYCPDFSLEEHLQAYRCRNCLPCDFRNDRLSTVRKIYYVWIDFSLCHLKKKIVPWNSGLQSILKAWLLKYPAVGTNVRGFLTIIVRSLVSQKNYARTRKREARRVPQRINFFKILTFITGIFLWKNGESIPMDTQQKTPHVKHDRRICERCQASNIKIRTDGSYSCNRCGYDSTKGK